MNWVLLTTTDCFEQLPRPEGLLMGRLSQTLLPPRKRRWICSSRWICSRANCVPANALR